MKKTIIILGLFIVSSLFADKSFNEKGIARSISLELISDFTKTFEGTINNKYAITMTLTKSKNLITGSYKYKSQANSLKLKGTIDNKGVLNMNEFNAQGNITGVFKGTLISGSIYGTWEKPDGSKSMPFSVSEVLSQASIDSLANINGGSNNLTVIDTGGAVVPKKSSSSFGGKYKDKFNQTITIVGNYWDEKIKFSIMGQLTQSCQGSEISGVAKIFRVNMNGVADNYKGPEYWYEYSDNTGCTISITPMNQTGSVEIKDENCNDYRGASCGDWTGVYKKSK